MDREFIDANQIVERYLLDRLSGEQIDAFERAMLADPDLRLELEAARELMLGLRAANMDGMFDALALDTDPQDVGVPGPSSPARLAATDVQPPRLRRIATQWPILASAAAMLGAIGLALSQNSQLTELQRQLDSLSARGATSTLLVPLPRTRSTEGVTTQVYASSKEQLLTLLPEVPQMEFELIQYELLSASQNLLLSARFAANSAPNITIPAAQLASSQHIQLRLTGINGAQHTDLGRYRFVVHLP